MENKVILVNISGLGVGKTNGQSPNTTKDLTDRLVCFLDNLNSLGLKRVADNNEAGDNVLGCYTRATVSNSLNDSFWGQWEIAGVLSQDQQFVEFGEVVDEEIRQALMTTFKSDVLCCKRMLGVHVLAEFGRLGRDASCPICFIGSDNTLNITCHENLFNQNQLNTLVESFMKTEQGSHIEKIATRIYAGTQNTFYNLGQSKTFVSKPTQKTMFQILRQNGIKTVGFGKIAEYFDEGEFDEVFETRTNDLSCKMLQKSMSIQTKCLLYINLMDNDQVFLQKGDLMGYRKCLEEVDQFIGRVKNLMNEGDMLIITADHGGDIINRENKKQDIPVLIYGTKFLYNHRFQALNSLNEIAEAVLDNFGVGQNQSFLKDIVSNA